MASGINSQQTDAPWKPRGLGHGVTWRCMGCDQHRYSTLGSKGAGLRKRCSSCVAAAEAKKAGRAAT
jgi:hypothetical protein